jgi:hypothetical protein
MLGSMCAFAPAAAAALVPERRDAASASCWRGLRRPAGGAIATLDGLPAVAGACLAPLAACFPLAAAAALSFLVPVFFVFAMFRAGCALRSGLRGTVGARQTLLSSDLGMVRRSETGQTQWNFGQTLVRQKGPNHTQRRARWAYAQHWRGLLA